MSDTLRVLHIPADPAQDATIVTVTADDAQFRELVGGWITPVLADNWVAFVDDDGEPKRLPENRRATDLARKLGTQTAFDVLLGSAIFLSFGTGDNFADVPQFVIDEAGAMFAVNTESGTPS